MYFNTILFFYSIWCCLIILSLACVCRQSSIVLGARSKKSSQNKKLSWESSGHQFYFCPENWPKAATSYFYARAHLSAPLGTWEQSVETAVFRDTNAFK